MQIPPDSKKILGYEHTFKKVFPPSGHYPRNLDKSCQSKLAGSFRALLDAFTAIKSKSSSQRKISVDSVRCAPLNRLLGDVLMYLLSLIVAMNSRITHYRLDAKKIWWKRFLKTESDKAAYLRNEKPYEETKHIQRKPSLISNFYIFGHYRWTDIDQVN